MNQDIELLLKGIKKSCELYENEKSLFDWKFMKNHQYISEIIDQKKIEELRKKVASYENPKKILDWIGSFFFLTKYQSILCYFDLMEVFSNMEKKQQPIDNSFLKILLSKVSSFIKVLSPFSELQKNLSVAELKIKSLPLDLVEDKPALEALLETPSKNFPSLEQFKSAVSIFQDQVHEFGDKVREESQSIEELQKEAMLLRQQMKKESEKLDRKLSEGEEEVRELKRMLQAQSAQRDAVAHVPFFPPLLSRQVPIIGHKPSSHVGEACQNSAQIQPGKG